MTKPTKEPWLKGIVQCNDRDSKRYLSRGCNRAEVEDLAQAIYQRLLFVERKDVIRSPQTLLFPSNDPTDSDPGDGPTPQQL